MPSRRDSPTPTPGPILLPESGGEAASVAGGYSDWEEPSFYWGSPSHF
jgi:hypothetical protein